MRESFPQGHPFSSIRLYKRYIIISVHFYMKMLRNFSFNTILYTKDTKNELIVKKIDQEKNFNKFLIYRQLNEKRWRVRSDSKKRDPLSEFEVRPRNSQNLSLFSWSSCVDMRCRLWTYGCLHFKLDRKEQEREINNRFESAAD